MEDVVKAEGYLTLGSRFRRLGERLQADVQLMADSHGIDIPSSLFTSMHIIDSKGTISVGELAEALGMSQPGATRIVNQLQRLSLASVKAGKDRRVKQVSLTRKAKAAVAKSRAGLWPCVERAVADACKPLKGDLLTMLDALEKSLDAVPLLERSKER
ncbi:MarR family transcriptional regulator [Aestuariivirga litoralis]|uniref:MarR family transcriptional regulator n=1 Tax=Aestuariivirga litoralis TaxID=2650924 RepID=UPI0018C53090